MPAEARVRGAQAAVSTMLQVALILGLRRCQGCPAGESRPAEHSNPFCGIESPNFARPDGAMMFLFTQMLGHQRTLSLS